MKTSIKLLLGLFLLLIVTMLGAAVSVRKQYDQIDKTDKYARWQKRVLPAFRVVQLSGPSAAIVQIEPGTTTRILADSVGDWRTGRYTQRVERDTLFLQINPAEGWLLRPDDTDDEWHGPQIVVQMPALRAVSIRNAVCQIRDFTGDDLTIRQTGAGGRAVLEHMTINQLTASLTGRNQLTLRNVNNRFGRGTVSVGDSARLFQYADFTQGLTLTASPAATLRLTGRTWQQGQR